MQKIITGILAAILITAFASCITYAAEQRGHGHEHKYEYIVELYTIRQEDTIDTIARKFIEKNTYGKREIREFTAGIRELNQILHDDEVGVGDVIKISYWISKE